VSKGHRFVHACAGEANTFYGRRSKFIRFSNGQQSTPMDLKIQLFLDDSERNPKPQAGIQSSHKVQ